MASFGLLRVGRVKPIVFVSLERCAAIKKYHMILAQVSRNTFSRVQHALKTESRILTLSGSFC